MNVPARIFIACPIGEEASDDRKRSDRLLKFVIAPVVQELLRVSPDEVLVRADKIASPGRITKQVIAEIVSCDVMIVDVTGDNPNVMYELGLRQALLRPYVLMAEKGHRLPFDLADIRTVFYQLDLDTVETAQLELKGHLDRALKGEVSAIDQDLLTARTTSDQSREGIATSVDVQVLEASSKILQEVGNVRDLLLSVGRIVIDIQGKEQREMQQRKEMFNQQMGMTLFQNLLQNPDALDKTLPAFQKLLELGMQVQEGKPDKPSEE